MNINKDEPLNAPDLENLYKSIDKLYAPIQGLDRLDSVIQKVLYMNLLKWVNNTEHLKFDLKRKELLHQFLSDPEHGKYTLASIAYSEADIFIIAGQDGIDNAFKYEGNDRNNHKKPTIGICDLSDLFNAEDTKKFCLAWNHGQGITQYGKTLFVSLYHPSNANAKRFTPNYILNRVDAIYERFMEIKEVKKQIAQSLQYDTNWMDKFDFPLVPGSEEVTVDPDNITVNFQKKEFSFEGVDLTFEVRIGGGDEEYSMDRSYQRMTSGKGKFKCSGGKITKIEVIHFECDFDLSKDGKITRR